MGPRLNAPASFTFSSCGAPPSCGRGMSLKATAAARRVSVSSGDPMRTWGSVTEGQRYRAPARAGTASYWGWAVGKPSYSVNTTRSPANRP